MHVFKAVIGIVVLAIAVAIPFSIDGYMIGVYLNDFLGYFCDVEHPVEDTSNIEWAKIMRGNASAIHEEFLVFEQAHKYIPRVSEVSEVQMYLDHQPKNAWRTLILRLYGRDSVHMKHFPKLQAALAHIPKVYTAMISIIEPYYLGGEHSGLYRGTLRYLLGLEVLRVLSPNDY